MDDQQSFYSQLNPYSPAGSQRILSSKDRGWSGFAALFLQICPIANFAPESADLTLVDQLTLHLSGIGRVEHVFDGQPHRGKTFPGSFCLTPRGYTSAWNWSHPTTVLNLYFCPTLLTQIASETDQEVYHSLTLRYHFNRHDSLIEQIGRAILSELQTAGALSHLYTESLIHTLAIHLLRNYSSIPSAPALSYGGLTKRQHCQVKAYIQEKLGEDLSLTELAAVAGLSRSYFCRQFKESTGLSPHQYLIQCRMERAEALLHEGRLTIAEIAHIVGFSDQSHLTHHFQEVFGLSPKASLQKGKILQKKNTNLQDDKR